MSVYPLFVEDVDFSVPWSMHGDNWDIRCDGPRRRILRGIYLYLDNSPTHNVKRLQQDIARTTPRKLSIWPILSILHPVTSSCLVIWSARWHDSQRAHQKTFFARSGGSQHKSQPRRSGLSTTSGSQVSSVSSNVRDNAVRLIQRNPQSLQTTEKIVGHGLLDPVMPWHHFIDNLVCFDINLTN
jgi:hypothetical protein